MIISQGSTIQHQLAGLKEKEEAIGTFEDRMHQVVTMVIMIIVVIFTGCGDVWDALAALELGPVSDLVGRGFSF